MKPKGIWLLYSWALATFGGGLYLFENVGAVPAALMFIAALASVQVAAERIGYANAWNDVAKEFHNEEARMMQSRMKTSARSAGLPKVDDPR